MSSDCCSPSFWGEPRSRPCDAPSVQAAARDAQVLINLVGILFERGRQQFDKVQTYGAEQVALAASATTT